MEILFILIFSLVCFIALIVDLLKQLNNTASSSEIFLGTIYILSLVLFGFGMLGHSNPYYIAIDPVDFQCYSPFSEAHAPTLLLYFFAFNFSIGLVWIKSKILPPLTLTLSLIFLVIGIIISAFIVVQLSTHNTDSLFTYNDGEEQIIFLFAPILSIIIGAWLIQRVIIQEISEAPEKKFANKYLHKLNTFLVTRSRKPIWIIILLIPVFFLVTLILILFGQEADSLVKVFTDTTTWKLSQQDHPPILDHQGHYLCTVAAKGSPKIVKPLRIGQRNGRSIVVNRQLQISNAFEEMIQDFSPKLHYVVRKNYDKYGYNVSKKINTEYLSNLTYLAMKPLEWFFLVCLYLFCNKPEQKITRQYTNE